MRTWAGSCPGAPPNSAPATVRRPSCPAENPKKIPRTRIPKIPSLGLPAMFCQASCPGDGPSSNSAGRGGLSVQSDPKIPEALYMGPLAPPFPTTTSSSTSPRRISNNPGPLEPPKVPPGARQNGPWWKLLIPCKGDLPKADWPPVKQSAGVPLLSGRSPRRITLCARFYSN